MSSNMTTHSDRKSVSNQRAFRSLLVFTNLFKSHQQKSREKIFLYSLILLFCVGCGLFIDVVKNTNVASAAIIVPPKVAIPGANFTLQQFLKQHASYQPTDAPLVVGNNKPNLAPSSKISTNNTQHNLPSIEPPNMKISYTSIPAKAVNMSSPTSNKRIVDTAIHVIGTDTQGVRLEVIIPAHALDLSTAKTIKGKTPRLPLTVSIAQQSGHFVGMTTTLGTFQVRITDAQGQTVNGLTLHYPATFILHYHAKELQKLDLEPKHLLMTWPMLASGNNVTIAKTGVIPMTNNVKASTLTAQSTILLSSTVTLGVSDPMNQSPQKPHMATTGGSTGQLSYSYPFVVAPGPVGTTPQLMANYSSAVTNGRHSPTAPADNLGEGWSLSMPSITTSIEGGGAVWYSLSNLSGVSDRLIPDSSTVTIGTNFATEHLSYLKIKMVDAGFDSQSCFHVWDTSGNYYEFGCTHDSMQYYIDSSNNRTNYRFDIDKFVPVNDGNTSRIVTYKYVQVSTTDSGYYTIRDAALVQIVYGTSATTAGTVDLFYNGPSNQMVNNTQFVTAYGNNEGGCIPPDSNISINRCDDPEDKSGGLPKAWVMSVLSLSTIKTYVGDDSATTHLDHSYSFAYNDNPYYNCTDLQSGIAAYCAGNHLLNSITPTVYQNSTGHTLSGTTFGYSADATRLNKYEDNSVTVAAGGDYAMQTNWRFLTSYHDHSNGVGATIVYHTAYNNSSGTPYSSDGDNRYDPFYCVWHSGDCTSNSPFYPYYNKMWTQQLVYQITQVGTDSSSSSLLPGTTTYHYLLTRTPGACAADSQGNSDCVGYGWIPNSTDSWQDFYHGEFRGFGTVEITSPSGDLTVQKYYATEGWDSSEGDAANYLAGSMYEEDVYSGGTINNAHLIKQTLNTYAGTNGTATSCSTSYIAGLYKPCEIIPLTSQALLYEQTGSAGPWVQTNNAWDDYSSSSGLVPNKYHNQLSETTSSSNASTKTQNWTYQTTDTTVNGTVYYNVHSAIHSELVDANSHKWSCSDTAYDQGETSGLPSPAAGWATTMATYSNCADNSTAINNYTGYDGNGNAVATIDGIASSHASLYSSAGCTLSTTPAYLTNIWTAGRYTSCTNYNANAKPTDTWNALGQHTQAVYDSTQDLQPTSVMDTNGLTTGLIYSYDSNGNLTTQIKNADESGAYTRQGTQKSTCTDSSTTPCLETDGNSLLYNSAVPRTFYDNLGRKVETLTPGPDSTHSSVTFVVYNDTTHSVFTSVSFVVANRTTWLDPNGATDSNGVTPGGTAVTLDPLERTLTMTDPLSHVSTTSYGLGMSGVSGDSNSYAITTNIDTNNHVSKSYTDVLNRTIYEVNYSGLSTGTLTAVKRTTTVYNALDKPTSVTVTDLAPQSGQAITSVTTTATYDDLGRLVGLNDPDRGIHTYLYDANGQTIGDTTGSGANLSTVGSKYDLLGRIGCIQNSVPAGTDVNSHGACSSGSTSYVQNTYDTDPSGITWSGASYSVGKLTQSVSTTTYPAPDNATGTVTENFQYDQRGHTITSLLNIAVTDGSIAFPTFSTYKKTQAYNDADQPTTTQTSRAGVTGYTFTQVYDSTIGIQTGLSNTSVGVASLAMLSYNARGLISNLTLKDSSGANRANESLLYDGALRPASATTTWSSSGTTIYNDGVSYDNMGNVISRVTTQAAVPGVSGSGGTEAQNFCYNEQNQLTWASNAIAATAAPGLTCGTTTLQGTLGGSYTSNYVYTHLGQLWQAPLNGSGTQEQYLYCNTSQPHQLTTLSPVSGNPTCASRGTQAYGATYDAYGNMSSRTYPAGTTGTPVYDSADRMVRWGGTTATSANEEWYLYDASGNRVLRRSASTTSSGNPATSAATITVYAFGLEEHVYAYSGSGSSATNSGNTYYYSVAGRLIGTFNGTSTQFMLADLLGSVVATISNTAGSAALLGNQIYGPYGNKRYSAGLMGTAKGFTGQYGDDLTGLDYYNARYYDPVVGRFTVADTVEGNGGGADPYAYVNGSPETKNDPTGLCAECFAAMEWAGLFGIELGPLDLLWMGLVFVVYLIFIWVIQHPIHITFNAQSTARSIVVPRRGADWSWWQQHTLVGGLASDVENYRKTETQAYIRSLVTSGVRYDYKKDPASSSTAGAILSIWTPSGKLLDDVNITSGFPGGVHAEPQLINWAIGILRSVASRYQVTTVNMLMFTYTAMCADCASLAYSNRWLMWLYGGLGYPAGKAWLYLHIWSGQYPLQVYSRGTNGSQIV